MTQDRRVLLRLTVLLGVLSLADGAITAALAIHLLRSVGARGLPLLALRFIPPVLSGAAAPGVLSRLGVGRTVLLVPAARSAFLACAAVALTWHAPLGTLLGLLTLDVMVAQWFRPALASVLPGVSHSVDELAAAGARMGNAKSVGAFAGTTLGAALGAWRGMDAACLVCAAMIAPATMWVPPAAVGRRTARIRIEPLPAGLRACRSRAATASIGVASLRTFLRGVWSGVVVLIVVGPLGLGTGGVGVLAAAAGIGGVASLALTRRLVLGRRLAGWLCGSLGLAAVALLVVAAIPVPALAVGAIALWGLCLAVADLTALTVLARVIDHRSVAGVSVVSENAKLVLEGAGTLAAPVLAGVVDVRAALAGASILVMVLVLVIWPVALRAEREVGERTVLLTVLAAAPLFRRMRIDALEILAGGARQVQRAQGDVLIRTGSHGADYWVLTAGSVQVRPPGGPFRVLSAGAGFGELALLHDIPRTADVVALEDVAAVLIDRETFLLAVTGANLVRPPVAAPRTGASPADLVAAAPTIAALGHGRARELARSAGRRRVAAGEVICRAGEVGDAVFVVLTGQVGVDLPGGPSLLGPGAEFGAIAVLHNLPRTATVTALSDAELAVVPATEFARG